MTNTENPRREGGLNLNIQKGDHAGNNDAGRKMQPGRQSHQQPGGQRDMPGSGEHPAHDDPTRRDPKHGEGGRKLGERDPQHGEGGRERNPQANPPQERSNPPLPQGQQKPNRA